ncbi:MAG TPA: hypothetical protein VL995_03675 [Cellvibrio sp.]|nr:hypothetical protein [Cellvibrio sp.]
MSARCTNILFFSLLMLVTARWVIAEEVMQVKYIGNNSVIREDYYIALIDAALKATKNDYGAYQINYSQELLASERKHELLVSGEKLNIDRLVGFPTNDGPRKGLLRVDVPILNGFMGYRILLIRAENQTRFSAISTLEELRYLPMGFGKGWEGHVYKYNGFTVAETTNVEMMLKMLAGKRYAFIPLSVIEIEDSYEIGGVKVDTLVPEKTLLIYMPLPVYFYVSPTEPVLAERLTKGLRALKASGEIDNIFAEHFSNRLQRLNLSQRKIIELGNPDNDGSLGLPDHRILQRF